MPEFLSGRGLGVKFARTMHGLGMWLEALQWAKPLIEDLGNVYLYQQLEINGGDYWKGSLNPLGKITLSLSRDPSVYLGQNNKELEGSLKVSNPVQQLHFTKRETKAQESFSMVTCQVHDNPDRKNLSMLSFFHSTQVTPCLRDFHENCAAEKGRLE